MFSRVSGWRYRSPESEGGGGGNNGSKGQNEQRAALLQDIKNQVMGIMAERGFKEGTTLDTLTKAAVEHNLNGVDMDTLRSLKPDTITNLVNEVDRLRTMQESSAQTRGTSLRQQIVDWQTRNKEAIESIRNGQRAEITPLEIRAPHTMQVSTDTAQPNTIVPSAQHIPGVVDLIRNQPYFLDYVNLGRTNRAVITWVNKVNKEGNAAFIGEAVLKPLASFQLEPEISNAKKVAERMKASTEILEDVDEMEALIRNELEYEVRMAVHTAMLFATRSATSVGGVTTYATPYTLVGVETTEPNNADAIRAAITQLITLNFRRNIIAFVNPVDAANLEMAKASDGHYIIVPFVTRDGQLRVKNVPVIEENDIPVGSVLVGDMSKINVRIYKDFTVSWGWENDDFSKNLVTVIGEMRLHEYHSDNHAGAWIYDTFANIKTAITAAP